MKVRMVKTAANPDGVWMADLEYDIEDRLARQFIEAGAAIPLEPVVETEAIEPQEKAVLPQGRPKGGKKK